MATFVNNNETITKYENTITNSLATLKSIKTSYSESITTANGHISSIAFTTWQDDVQESFQLRTDQLKEEMRKVETSVNSEHLPLLISKLEGLQEQLSALKKANSQYNSSKKNLATEEEKLKVGDANAHIVTHYESECRKYKNQISQLVTEINSTISTISSINFGVAIESGNENSSGVDAITGASPSEGTSSNDTITQYYDSATGCTVAVTMTTTEEDGNIVQTRTTTYTDSNGNVTYSETSEIITNKDDPRQVKVVDEEGNVYETTVDENGQLVEVTKNTDKNGNTTTETSPIGETYYTMTVTNNSTGETTTHTINTESPADMAMFRMYYENANMEAGTKESNAFEGNHHFTLGEAQSITLGGYSNNPTVTVTFTPNE